MHSTFTHTHTHTHARTHARTRTHTRKITVSLYIQIKLNKHTCRAGKIRSPSRYLRPRNIFGDQIIARGGQLATNFSTKGPVWRPQFWARFHEQTALYGDRKTNDRFPKTKFKISKTFLVIRVTFTWHTLTRSPALSPPPPTPSNTVVPFFFW